MIASVPAATLLPYVTLPLSSLIVILRGNKGDESDWGKSVGEGKVVRLGKWIIKSVIGNNS